MKTLLWCVAVLSLFGCSGGEEFADLRDFMAEVEQKPKGRITPLPQFESYQAFSYGASNLRSPFEPPIVVPKRTKVQAANIGVKPPENHAKEYLERFNIAALSMVGTLAREGDNWALIQDSSGGVHRVQVGDYMGTNWGKIESITDARIDITEIVGDGAGGWLRRPRSIELQGF